MDTAAGAGSTCNLGSVVASGKRRRPAARRCRSQNHDGHVALWSNSDHLAPRWLLGGMADRFRTQFGEDTLGLDNGLVTAPEIPRLRSRTARHVIDSRDLADRPIRRVNVEDNHWWFVARRPAGIRERCRVPWPYRRRGRSGPQVLIWCQLARGYRP
jgi:hypothetical protein